MAKSRSNSLIFLLALAGLCVALILVVKHFLPEIAMPGCSVTAGCSSVLKSVYGQVGPIPIGAFGAAMYAILCALCLRRRTYLIARREAEGAEARVYATTRGEETVSAEPEYGFSPMAPPFEEPAAPSSAMLGLREEIRRIDGQVWLIALLGIGISWGLQYVALYKIESFCPYCFSSAILITSIFLLASRDFLLEGRNLNGEQKMLGAVGVFILACLFFVILPDIVDQYNRVTHPAASPMAKSDLASSVIATADMETKGDPKAPYTIVEFADYQCSHCAQSSKEIDKLLKDNPQKFRLGFRNFPLSKHLNAETAAIAAEAAGEQGKFWQMHDVLFRHQADLDSPTFDQNAFSEYAKEAGLDIDRWKNKSRNPKYKQKVEHDLQACAQGNLDVTPTFFLINPRHKMWRFSGETVFSRAINDPKNEIYK